jgi:diguanylate cyclase (GGDEF)-like protein
MRQFVRQNGLLVIGFALSLAVLLVPPIGRALDVVNDIERQTQLRFLPALIVLIGFVLFSRTRQKHRTQALAAAEAAAADVAKREGGRRAHEMQRLVAFANAAATALDHDAIKSAINLHLARVTGSDQLWVLTREGPKWEPLVGGSDPAVVAERVEFAERLLAGNRAGVTRDHRAGFPLMVGDNVMGVLGINAAGRLEEERQRTIEAAASLLAVSLKNVQVFRDVKETGVRDGLTGCWTRTHAMEVLDAELRRARRSKLPVAIILFDLDHFKQINDRYGHLCGDTVLMQIGKRMHDVLRSSDLKSRYGGEEFLAVLPSTSLHGAGCVAETLRREIESKPIPWGNDVLTVTASLGVTQAEPGELDIETIIARADAALYRAKQQGRNCVRLEPDNPPPPPSDGRKADVAVDSDDAPVPG